MSTVGLNVCVSLASEFVGTEICSTWLVVSYGNGSHLVWFEENDLHMFLSRFDFPRAKHLGAVFSWQFANSALVDVKLFCTSTNLFG